LQYVIAIPSDLRDDWSVVQPHIDLGEFIGSSETEDPMLAMSDVDQNAEEIQTPLAMWEAGGQSIELEKGSRGLGFSILDYQVNISHFPNCHTDAVF
jgi:multiple PDZ domain protein